jgi:hypothetical protein
MTFLMAIQIAAFLLPLLGTVAATLYALGKLRAEFDRVSDSCDHLAARIDILNETLQDVRIRVATVEGAIRPNGTHTGLA